MKDYKLNKNGLIVYGIDNEIVNYNGNDENNQGRPVPQMNMIKEMINNGKLFIEDNKWYLNRDDMNHE